MEYSLKLRTKVWILVLAVNKLNRLFNPKSPIVVLNKVIDQNFNNIITFKHWFLKLPNSSIKQLSQPM